MPDACEEYDRAVRFIRLRQLFLELARCVRLVQLSEQIVQLDRLEGCPNGTVGM